MTADFQYTLEDLVEAQRAHRQMLSGRGGGDAAGGPKWMRVAQGALLVAAIVGALLIFASARSAGGPGGTPAATMMIGGGLFLLAGPAFLVLLVVRWVLRLRRPRARRQIGSAAPLNAARGLFAWVLFIALAVMLFMLLNKRAGIPGTATAAGSSAPPPAPPAVANPLMDILVPLIPWLLIFGFVWFFVFRQMRFGVRRVWDATPSLQLRKHVEATPEHVVIDDTQTRTEMRWSAIRRFSETPNLFLLYTSDLNFFMIAKRGFGGGAGGEQSFRELLAAHVQAPVGGFPVMQGATADSSPPPPLPASTEPPAAAARPVLPLEPAGDELTTDASARLDPVSGQGEPGAHPPPLRVELQFEYTPAELREGLKPAPLDVRAARAASASRPAVKWLTALALSAILLGSLVVLITYPRPVTAAAPPAPQRPPIDLWLSLGTSYAAAGILGVMVAIAALVVRLNRAPQPARRKWTPRVIMTGLLSIAGILWIFLGVEEAPPLPNETPIPRGILLALALVPWIVLLAALLMLVRTAVRRMVNRPSFRRRRFAVIDGEGMQHGDDIAWASYRWPYFRRAWETQNVLVLVDENQLRHILPKRAFATPAELQVARALIVTHVAEASMLVQPQGFDMNHVSAGPPLPVLPVDPTQSI